MAIENENIISNFIQALQIEVNEQRSKSVEESLDLENGERQSKTADKVIYAFFINEDLRATKLRDDVPVTLIVGDSETEATIVSAADKKVIISTNDDLGKHLPLAKIKFDNSYLTEKLRKNYEDYANGKASAINLETIKKCFLYKDIEISKTDPVLDKSSLKDLNDEQLEAVKVSQGSDVTFIWGPPGTGKTHCISRIIESFYKAKKRILIASNTNSAVDIVILHLCKKLSQDKNDEDFNKGGVLRYGEITNPELKKDYAEYVNVDKAAERLSKELAAQKEKLVDQLNKLKDKAKPHIEIINAFKSITRIHSQNRSDLDRLLYLTTYIKGYLDTEKSHKKAIAELKIQLEDSRKSSFLASLFKAKPEFYENEIRKQLTKLDQLNENKQKYPEEVKQLEIKLKSVGKDLEKAKSIIQNKNREEEEKKLKIVSDEIDGVDRQVAEVTGKIEQLKTSVLNNCRVLGATSTKVSLKPEDFKNFDVVVVDEASMLILPAAAFVASLSKDKVIFAGDFRQIPPIVRSNDDLVNQWVAPSIFDKVNAEERIKDNKTKNFIILRRQYRMNEKICEVINKVFYDGRLITDKSVKTTEKYPQLIKDNLILINTSSAYPFVNSPKRSFSRYNLLHALAIRNLCNYLKENEVIKDAKSLGVTTPYSYQTSLIRDCIKELGINDVACGTVHSFQGDEKNIMIFDITDSHGANPSQLIETSDVGGKASKVINVALSRAKDVLIIFANMNYLNDQLADTSILRKILNDFERRGTVIDVKEIIDLGPFNIPDKPATRLTTKIKIKEKDTGTFNSSTFEGPFEEDLKKAKKYIVIFSAFLTEKRVASWGELFKQKIKDGVKIRVVTKGPANQASFKASATAGIKHLIEMKVIVDLRKDIHQKIIFIDDEVLWFGSLNVLSYTGETDETILRIYGPTICNSMAKHQLYKYSLNNSDKKVSPVFLLAERENNSCNECQNITEVLFRQKDRVPFLRCISCGNMQDMKEKYSSKTKTSTKKNSQLMDEAIEEVKVQRICPEHKVNLKLRNGRKGKFYGCPKYPNCKHTENY